VHFWGEALSLPSGISGYVPGLVRYPFGRHLPRKRMRAAGMEPAEDAGRSG